MSKIFDLINELCPNGVEFRELGEIFQRIKGTNITANKMKEIEVHGGDIRIFAGGKTVIDTTEDKIQNPNITRVPSVIVQSRGVIDFIYYDKPFTFKNEMWGYTSENETSIKFLYYYLKNNISYFRAASISMGALPQISLPITEKFKLPVPPMEVQREIVRILDSFTLLTAELTARKKQYEFYRDFLLSFDELDKNGGGCELKMLGEICDLIAGGDISKDKVSKEKDIKFKFPIYSNGIGDNALYGFTDEPRVMKQCVTISARGTIGYCALRLDPFYPIVRLICAIPKSNITAQFLKYFLDTQKISVPTSGISQLTIPMVAKIKIPVPSLQTQQKVVDILDKFDTLVNSITEGLPREIELRRKQYEYYRELLLNFKPKMRA
ncbi:restriction endonuclease subunit S [Campylobacter concisus]|uniref:restriction endonuclease subunit S n=1 Tax=Campylobacter concisus TaxID=199 RepID=UPI0011E6C858|nr:restriction endonuclease subunit S [Campylobacter concisus]